MKHFHRYVSAAIVATVMTLGAVTPANAVVDARTGEVVAIIIDSEGNVYY